MSNERYINSHIHKYNKYKPINRRIKGSICAYIQVHMFVCVFVCLCVCV